MGNCGRSGIVNTKEIDILKQLSKESRDKLEKEIYEVEDRISKLREFVKANKKDFEGDIDFELVVQQGQVMAAYLGVLKMRMSLDTEKVNAREAIGCDS